MALLGHTGNAVTEFVTPIRKEIYRSVDITK